MKHADILIWYARKNSYTIDCPPVRGIVAEACVVDYVIVQRANQGITIIYNKRKTEGENLESLQGEWIYLLGVFLPFFKRKKTSILLVFSNRIFS